MEYMPKPGSAEDRRQRMLDYWLQIYRQPVADLLGLAPVQEVQTVISPTDSPKFAAFTDWKYQGSQRVMVVTAFPNMFENAKYLPSWPETVLVHELTHATIFQTSNKYGQPGTLPWAFQEGIADWTAHHILGHKNLNQPSDTMPLSPDEKAFRFNPRWPKQYGYGDMAAFMTWQEKRAPGFVPHMAATLALNASIPQNFVNATGTTVHDSIAEFKLSRHEQTPARANTPNTRTDYSHQQL